MDSDDSLERGVRLLESLTLHDSCINTNTLALSQNLNKNNSLENVENKEMDTCRVNLDQNSDIPEDFDPGGLETARIEEEIPICTNPSCNLTIKTLEKKINLLETQNSQLIINSCSMYNTLMKHIESLREELKKKEEKIKKQMINKS